MKRPAIKGNPAKADEGFNEMLDDLVRVTFRDALRASIRDPQLAGFFLRTLKAQKKASVLRAEGEENGVRVPPLMILSVTEQCNLHCAGCYSQGLRGLPKPEMGPEQLERLFTEASGLGLSIVLLAGGEPLMKPWLLDVTAKFPRTIFPLLTNGYLLDDAVIARLKEQRHVIPMLSLEGFATETDLRRGTGTYEHVLRAMERLQAAGIFFGASVTVTRLNCETVTGDRFVTSLLDRGCKAFFFVEYSPVREGTEGLVPTPAQRERLAQDRSGRGIRQSSWRSPAKRKSSAGASRPGAASSTSARPATWNPVHSRHTRTPAWDACR